MLDFPLTCFVSWLSFKYFEQPITAWGRRRAEALTQEEPSLWGDFRNNHARELV